jgi:phosphopantothenoylcysteine decarboxylase / phosphopantothenate---cysteine ligase
VLAPAMHTEMWEHPAVQDNIALLARRGVHVVAPAEGRLAGGDMGKGRLADPAAIVAAVDAVLAGTADLEGLQVLVTASGTREPVDPVRYLGNRSSGKQGHAAADEAAARGAKVTLVTTTRLPGPPGADVVRVETAAEMAAAVESHAATADVVVMAAAVADFRPVQVAERKLRKRDGIPELVLEQTPDILAALGARKRPGQTLVGFAAETDDLRKNAAAKLAAKGVDLVVANDVSAPGVGFEHDTNAVTLLSADGAVRDVPLTGKREVARELFDVILERRSNP